MRDLGNREFDQRSDNRARSPPHGAEPKTGTPAASARSRERRSVAGRHDEPPGELTEQLAVPFELGERWRRPP